MKYTYKPQDYIDQLISYNELESLSFSPNDSYEFIILKLEERSKKKRTIALVADNIISEYIEPYEKDISKLTSDDVKELEEFAEKLYPDGKMFTEIKVTDFGVFYRLQNILVDYYKLKGDTSKLLFMLSRKSLAYLYLVNGHSFVFQESPFRKDCLDLIHLLDSDEIDEAGKQKLRILLVREITTSDDHFATEELQLVFDKVRSSASSNMPIRECFNHYILCETILQLFREHSIWAKRHNVKVDIEKNRSLIESAIKYVDEVAKKIPQIDVNMELATYKATANFFLGNITLDELLNILDEVQNRLYKSDNPFDKARGLGSTNNYYLNILYSFSPLPKDEIIRISKNRINEILPKLLGIKRLNNNVQFNRYMVEFLNAASLTGDFDEFSQIILDSTVYADKALFIHTMMVKEMSMVIFDYLIEASPDVFNGVAGKDTDYIINHKDEMKELLKECCMFHDIGKFFMLDIVENSMRKLTDDEFMLIKNHPLNFTNIYQMTNAFDERVKCIHDCGLTHHLWHDESGGYPNVHHTKNLPFVDIITISDSIDAATDFLGRPYGQGKSIDELISEFTSRAGSQYGPIATQALHNKSVRDKLEYLITEGRKDIYYHIYAFNKL